MNVEDILRAFDDRAGADFSALIRAAEAFLAEHYDQTAPLQDALATWSGTPTLPRAVEHRALAISDALRSLHRLVAAGVDADRPIPTDPEPEAPECPQT